MERVRRCLGHGLPTANVLSTKPPLTAEQVKGWTRYSETSRLYTHLAQVIAGDSELLRVLNRIEHTPRLNVLLAGVQFLMLRDGGAELSAHYPNFTSADASVEGVGRPFTEFVHAHEEELVDIGRTRYTQTNECRRCVALLPAVWETSLDHFHLVDLGTSAGLNLLVDRYHYVWGPVEWGPESTVRLTTDNRGRDVEPRQVEILSRIGLDLSPIDPNDASDAMWLEALVWPEHHDRRQRLRAALGLAVETPLRLVAGDALETLGPILDGLPSGEPVVVMNSFVLNQLPRHDRERVGAIIEARRPRREVSRVSVEWLDPSDEAAVISVEDGSGQRVIGAAQPHGEWIELYARP